MLAPAVSLAQAPTQTRSPEAGVARPWEAGMWVNRYTQVNLYTGNAISIFPIMSCDPVGPPLHFELYHNLAGSDDTGGPAAYWGFDLGGGWRPAYSSRLVEDGGSGDVLLIEDDGNEWLYELVSGEYVPPAGKFDTLEIDVPTSGHWTLTRMSQWTREFDEDGRLIKETDSAGNTLTIVYTSGNAKIEYIKSAADGLSGVGEHRLVFSYFTSGVLSGKLEKITEKFDNDNRSTDRVFEFDYETASPYRLKTIEDARDNDTIISYPSTTKNRIKKIKDRTGEEWEYTYTANLFTQCKDPEVDTDSYDPFTVNFVYSAFNIGAGRYITTVTDRRGEDWLYKIDSDGRLRELIDPLNNESAWTYDDEHNRLTYTNELDKTWTATYAEDGGGRAFPIVETLTTPLTSGEGGPQVFQYATTQPSPSTDPNFFLLVATEDPDGNEVTYEYEDATDPTAVTSVIEPADGQGNGAATTTFTYYDDSDANARGQIESVTDAGGDGAEAPCIGVKHEFEYDMRGYNSCWKESANSNCAGYYTSACCAVGGGGEPQSGSSAWGCYTVTVDGGNNKESTTCEICIAFGPSLVRIGYMPSPDVASMTGCTDGNTYDAENRATGIFGCINSDLGHENLRHHELAYDELGRPKTLTITSDEHAVSEGATFERAWDATGNYDQEGNLLDLVGPDGEVASMTYDELGRIKTVTRSNGSASIGVADVVYDAAGRVTEVEYENGATSVYTYDSTNRPLTITHKDGSNATTFKLTYTWNKRNLVTSRVEEDYTVSPATTHTVTFAYDLRSRLIGEERVLEGSPDTTVYDISYTYDQVGNRTSKFVDLAGTTNDVWTDYFYDTDPDNRNPEDYFDDFSSNANRLVWYTEKAGGQSGTLRRTVYYTYYNAGHVSNITIKDESDPLERRGLALYYDAGGRMWLAMQERWEVDDEWVPTWAGDPCGSEGAVVANSYERLSAREFRYDSGRARYMVRDVDPNDNFAPLTPDPENGIISLWTDYAGNMPWLDADLDADGSDNAEISPKTGYLGTAASIAVATSQPAYMHEDLIGSTNMTSDAAGDPVESPAVAFTAFGELVDPGATPTLPAAPPEGFPRYQYAGAWGYESGWLELEGANGDLPPITLQHVGERWYDPGIGRFVQRDPIGIGGGINVYMYCRANSLTSIDPSGLWDIDMPVTIGDGVDTSSSVIDLFFPPGIVSTLGVAANARETKSGLFLKPTASPTKNVISSRMIRYLGTDLGFRYVAPWLGPVGIGVDMLLIFDLVIDIQRKWPGAVPPCTHLPPHMVGPF